MDEKKRKAAIEAILFTMGDAVELSRIAEAIGEDTETTRETIRKMMKDYQKKERGIQIIELDQSFQLCTKKEYYEDLIRIARHPKKPALSDVAMETLSIVAYKQPVTKIEIEKIRGVKCDHAINKLIEYNLIREIGRLGCSGPPHFFLGHNGRISEKFRCTVAGGSAGDQSGPGRGFQGRSRGRGGTPAECLRKAVGFIGCCKHTGCSFGI